MKLKEIRALAQLMESAGLSALEYSDAEARIRLEKAVCAQTTPPRPIDPPARREEIAAYEGAVDFNRITEIKSPMVGIFYAAPSPDAAPYVRVGSKVKKGDVLCVIEAMKLMNEIVAETDGEIVDVCAENAQVVEYAQILFKVF